MTHYDLDSLKEKLITITKNLAIPAIEHVWKDNVIRVGNSHAIEEYNKALNVEGEEIINMALSYGIDIERYRLDK